MQDMFELPDGISETSEFCDQFLNPEYLPPSFVGPASVVGPPNFVDSEDLVDIISDVVSNTAVEAKPCAWYSETASCLVDCDLSQLFAQYPQSVAILEKLHALPQRVSKVSNSEWSGFEKYVREMSSNCTLDALGRSFVSMNNSVLNDLKCLMNCFQQLLHSRLNDKVAQFTVLLDESVRALCKRVTADNELIATTLQTDSTERLHEFVQRLKDRYGLNVYGHIQFTYKLVDNGITTDLSCLDNSRMSELVNFDLNSRPTIEVTIDKETYDATRCQTDDRHAYRQIKKQRRLKDNADSAKRARFRTRSNNMVVFFQCVSQFELIKCMSK